MKRIPFLFRESAVEPELSRCPYIYILASGRNGTLYAGMTSDLVRRVFEHKGKFVEGFTEKYDIARLVYFFETHDDPGIAVQRERNVKHWRRDWKIALIEQDNPEWNDLYESIAR